MTEREMLELAAKAAGYDVEIDYYGPGYHGKKSADIGVGPVIWNPLTSDGDALRLAAKLGLQIDMRMPEILVYGAPHGRVDEPVRPGIGPHDATRNAIVRAAAEIGRSKHE